MMYYIIDMGDGKNHRIPAEEAKNIMKAKGLMFVPSLNGFLNISFARSILPESISLGLTVKYLHDGTEVVSMGGKWKIRGHEDLEIDIKKYPEALNEMLLLKNPPNEQSPRNLPQKSK